MEKGVNMGAKFEITVLEFKEFYIPIGIQHTLMHILNKCKQKNVNIKYINFVKMVICFEINSIFYFLPSDGVILIYMLLAYIF